MTKSIKPHIGIFGRCNVGKSSLINALSNQITAIVSEEPGTTTDPVKKFFELGPVGAVVLIDTAGLDDLGILGSKRKMATQKVFDECDLALIVTDTPNLSIVEEQLISDLQIRKTPLILVLNKNDLIKYDAKCIQDIETKYGIPILSVSSRSGQNMDQLLSSIDSCLPKSSRMPPTIVGDLINSGDIVILVTPIDIEAPQGRLILPQVQTIRDILDNDAITIILKERELDHFFRHNQMPIKLVITDSQVFLKVRASVPREISLTSFSILFARMKGDFMRMVQGTKAIKLLNNNDHVLILESCSHHQGGDDIGRVKIPRWLTQHTGKNLHFDVIAGTDSWPQKTETYKMVIHCGGCMATTKQIENRLAPFVKNQTPISNYGMTIAYCMGIFNDALKVFNLNEDIEEL